MPDKKIRKRNTFFSYNEILKYNGTEPRNFGGRPLRVGQELTINKEAEFDTWVLGAMAELSEDGKAPEDVTYEKVLRLAQQIRESLIK